MQEVADTRGQEHGKAWWNLPLLQRATGSHSWWRFKKQTTKKANEYVRFSRPQTGHWIYARERQDAYSRNYQRAGGLEEESDTALPQVTQKRWSLVSRRHDWVRQRPGPEGCRSIKDICDSTKNEKNSKEQTYLHFFLPFSITALL